MYEYLSLASAGIGALNTIFGKDPDRENMARFKDQQGMYDRRMDQALAAGANWKGFYDDAAAQMAPRLAFAQRQAGMSANAGASRAQANIRRQLGGAGNPFAEAIGSGLQTGANLQQTSLRALAESDMIGGAQRMAQAQAGLIAQSPVAQMPAYTGFKNQQTSSLFGNLATSLGAYGQYQDWQKRQDKRDKGYQ